MGGLHRGRDGSHQRGPKTFRRGRAIAFLEMMNLKRTTIKQQMDRQALKVWLPNILIIN